MGFRPKRGAKDALREVDQLLKEGYTWVVDADLKSFFDSIPHEYLQKQLKRRISDGALRMVCIFQTCSCLYLPSNRRLCQKTPEGSITKTEEKTRIRGQS